MRTLKICLALLCAMALTTPESFARSSSSSRSSASHAGGKTHSVKTYRTKKGKVVHAHRATNPHKKGSAQ